MQTVCVVSAERTARSRRGSTGLGIKRFRSGLAPDLTPELLKYWNTGAQRTSLLPHEETAKCSKTGTYIRIQQTRISPDCPLSTCDWLNHVTVFLLKMELTMPFLQDNTSEITLLWADMDFTILTWTWTLVHCPEMVPQITKAHSGSKNVGT